MEPESLERAIAKRKQEAQEKGIGEKAALVARQFGMVRRLGDHMTTTGWAYVYDESSRYSTGGSHLLVYLVLDLHGAVVQVDVSCEDRPVFSQSGGNVCCFVPGNWEKDLDVLYRESCERAKKDREREATFRRLREQSAQDLERTKWGL